MKNVLDTYRLTSNQLHVWSANNNIVWNAWWRNTREDARTIRLIFWNKIFDLEGAIDVTLSLKENRDVIIWHASVGTNFVTNAELAGIRVIMNVIVHLLKRWFFLSIWFKLHLHQHHCQDSKWLMKVVVVWFIDLCYFCCVIFDSTDIDFVFGAKKNVLIILI